MLTVQKGLETASTNAAWNLLNICSTRPSTFSGFQLPALALIAGKAALSFHTAGWVFEMIVTSHDATSGWWGDTPGASPHPLALPHLLPG